MYKYFIIFIIYKMTWKIIKTKIKMWWRSWDFMSMPTTYI